MRGYYPRVSGREQSSPLSFANGERMTTSEFRFFGGPRDFKRNVLRKIKGKEI